MRAPRARQCVTQKLVQRDARRNARRQEHPGTNRHESVTGRCNCELLRSNFDAKRQRELGGAANEPDQEARHRAAVVARRELRSGAWTRYSASQGLIHEFGDARLERAVRRPKSFGGELGKTRRTDAFGQPSLELELFGSASEKRTLATVRGGLAGNALQTAPNAAELGTRGVAKSRTETLSARCGARETVNFGVNLERRGARHERDRLFGTRKTRPNGIEWIQQASFDAHERAILPEGPVTRYGSAMKVARRLALTMIIGIALALTLHAVFGVRREIDLFTTDSRNDELVLGRALGPAFSRIWQLDGKRQALDLLQRVNAHEGTLRARWLPADRVPELGGADTNVTDDGLIVVERKQGDDPALFTYVPVALARGDKSVIELTESSSPRREYVRASLIRAGITAAGIASWCAFMAALLGVAMVGRPIRALVEHARRIGAGDLEGRAPVLRHDEIGELAVEMNAMAERLGVARDELAAETNARLGALNQLRHADRLATVGKLASGVAHELGTPLNVVAGRAKMIRTAAQVDETARKNARIVEEQADRMTRIIRQLLDFARAGQSSSERFDPKRLAEKTITLVQPDANRHGVRLALSAPERGPELLGDPSQIQQVITNLLVNAIHSMSKAGTVTVSLGERELRRGGGPPRSFVVLAVTDEGTGMTPEVAARVFEPFFTTKDVGEGTGLGLSVAFGIVEEHGGFLEVETAPERGSRFSVYLPIPPAG